MSSSIRRDAIAVIVAAAAGGLVSLLPPISFIHGWSIDVLTALRFEVFGPRRDPKAAPAVIVESTTFAPPRRCSSAATSALSLSM